MKQHFEDFLKPCLQDEVAYCTAACPFHMDVRNFMEKMSRGAFGAAFKIYRDATAFPRIAASLCGGRCRSVCPRAKTDAALNMELLEKAAIQYAPSTAPNRYNLPGKPSRVAIVGAGPSGLACALRLASRRMDVTVFEKSGRVGGSLWDALPPEIFLPDIEEQFKNEKYTLNLNGEIKSLDELAGFDAVYMATGAGGETFGLSPDEAGAFASGRPGVFMGGSLTGSDCLESLADGLNAVHSIERYLKTGAMNQPPLEVSTRLEIDPAVLVPTPQITPAGGSSYTEEEAVSEAKRCVRCSCDACRRRCDFMEFYKKFPKRICDEVALTIEPASIDGEETYAKRLMATCNQCGLCADVCPQGIDMGAFLLESRRAMHRKGKLPWVFHDFWLRDMRHALSPEASLIRTPAGTERPEYVFFPGCQLGASCPEYVTESYRCILAAKPGTALWLGCCGAPAVWSGDEELSGETFAALNREWEGMGKPKLLFACPTCKQMFERHIPEAAAESVFLLDFMRKENITAKRPLNGEKYCVFDPCASRHEPVLQDAARELALNAGAVLEPLPDEGEQAKCCGWGGHVSVANPAYADKVAQKRMGESGLPYITYCVNCRDIFASKGKECLHILDILFDLNASNRPSPGWSRRRTNRERLKADALAEFWNERPESRRDAIDLTIGDELRKKLDAELILEEDVRAAVAACERSGRTVAGVGGETGDTLCGYAPIGRVTYWVEYKRLPGGGYLLLNAYSHRMKIEIEETWNGRKTSDYM